VQGRQLSAVLTAARRNTPDLFRDFIDDLEVDFASALDLHDMYRVSCREQQIDPTALRCVDSAARPPAVDGILAPLRRGDATNSLLGLS
jgi:hypothetical protein